MLGENIINKTGRFAVFCVMFVLAVCALTVGPVSSATLLAAAAGVETAGVQDKQSEASSNTAQVSPDERMTRMEGTLQDMKARMESTLQDIKDTGEKSEVRSYQNKMMARELIKYVQLMVGVLVLIAVGFPFTVWLLSKKRILGLSGLSQEVSATLLVIEERQAKLANILKDIQGEIDYLHTMSVPDLKNLIKQAENYLEQNEKDLAKAGREKQ